MSEGGINIRSKFELFADTYSPKVIAEINDYQFKVVKIKGDFVWHSHEDTDEVFMIIQGSMVIDFRDKQVTLSEGDMYVVPKGVEHKPYAESECRAMIIEPKGVVNTGNASGDLTAENDQWI
ncbi:unnamed protein product [Ectocarpus fasciculatus]